MAREEGRINVRTSVSQVALRQAVNKALNTHIRSLQKDPALRRRIATEWAQAVTPFVPRSDNNVPHHLQEYRVESDGRVIWTRQASRDDKRHGIVKGQQIAGILYEGPINGKFRKRQNGGVNGYGKHRPTAQWDENVRPGTAQWSTFVRKASIIVKRWLKNG